jgi:phospholipase C
MRRGTFQESQPMIQKSIQEISRKMSASALCGILLLSGCSTSPGTYSTPASSGNTSAAAIKHIVVIFGENISFDHYFATYPTATNPSGETQFHALAGTPSVEGLSGSLMTANPNLSNTANGAGAANPFRLDPADAATSDQDHDYTPEQMAFDNGKMDLFPVSLGTPGAPVGAPAPANTTGLTMGYYDGNTVTALWNYAQHFSLNDHSFGTNFGPSTDGAINLISGQTNGVVQNLNGTGSVINDGNGGLTLISDADPLGDVCSTTTGEVLQMGGTNVGDLLNAANVTWGFFEGGFDLTQTNSNGTTGCARTTKSAITATTKADYIPHHQPFQYYKSTANPAHTRPTSVATIGHQGDAANHQYDMSDFYNAVNAGNMPSVSYLKAAGYQDAHAGYSDPLDEQAFVVHVLNFLQNTPYWSSTAVIIAYDDSDGWYDHVMNPIVNPSTSAADTLTAAGECGNGTSALPGINPATTHAQGRCGYGPRLPLMVISPWAKPNFVDSTVTDQSSVLRFVEDVFLKGQRIGQGSFDSVAGPLDGMFDFSKGAPQNTTKLFLDETTGKE